MKKFIKTTVMVIISSLCMSASVFASETVIVRVNGVPLATKGQIVNDSTLVPIREISESLGATVNWEESTQKITILQNANFIDSATGEIYSNLVTAIMTIGDNKIYVNGVEGHLDAPAQIIDSKTMVPARAVSECVGASVKWDDKTKVVDIEFYTPTAVAKEKATKKPNEVAVVEKLDSDKFAEEVVNLVNAEREKVGAAPLVVRKEVQEAAQVRAVEIEKEFSHTRPDGTTCFTALDESGATNMGSGENIASGQESPAEVMESWMNSEGHKANILRKEFTHIGVGHYLAADDMNYWTQMFTYN